MTRTLAQEERDYLEMGSRVATLLMLAAALCICLAAPLLAISWSATPFPGFLLDPTLVVDGSGNPDWTGRLAGINYPQHVQRITGIGVANSSAVSAVLAEHTVGQTISVYTNLPDGSGQLYSDVTLTTFAPIDMLRFFWLPYVVGVAYLIIGIWMYRLRGSARPGRAFSFFCFCIAVVCMLLFDLYTTHAAIWLWTAAIALAGGALISLALRFPEEGRLVTRWPWLLVLPYGVSLGLAVWGIMTLYSALNPWEYVAAWGTSYRYAALGVLVFLVTTVFRAATSVKPAVRTQARIVLLGSGLAFIPVTIWFITPLLGTPLNFDASIFLPSLLIFPMAVAIAIFRYRLMEIEVIINRTLFYGVMTALLAGGLNALIALLQRLFMAFTGQRSDAAIVITTLLLVAAFDRFKVRAQSFVDRQFKETPDATRDLRSFGDEVQSVVRLSDETHMARALLDQAALSLHAQSGAVSLLCDGQYRTVHTVGRWTGDARLCVALEDGRQRYGLVSLGPRQSWAPYTRQECEAVRCVAQDVARSIRLARALNSLPALSDANAVLQSQLQT